MKAEPKLYIPEEVLSKIRYLCRLISKNEWNAILFYKITKGQIENPDSLELEAVDIHPMAKGDSASVDFEYDTDWIDVYDEKEHLENCKMGVIHSHVNMGVFHSGTDYNDLETNCDKYDFYLSVVVNNDLDVEAKIAVKAEREIEKKTHTTGFLKFKNSLGKLIKHPINQDKEETETEDLMLVFEVNIYTPEAESVEDKMFTERVDHIIKEAEKPKYGTQTAMGFGGYGGIYGGDEWDFGHRSSIRSEFDKKKDTNKQKSLSKESTNIEDVPNFEGLLDLIDDVLDVVHDKEYTNVSDGFSDFLETDFEKPEQAASLFISSFIKAVEGDAEINCEKDEEKSVYVINTLDELIDYIGYFGFSELQNAILLEIEKRLKTYGTK